VESKKIFTSYSGWTKKCEGEKRGKGGRARGRRGEKEWGGRAIKMTEGRKGCEEDGCDT